MQDRKLDLHRGGKDFKMLGWPFVTALFFEIDFYESDLNSINYIKSHPLFRYVNGNVFGNTMGISMDVYFVQTVFYEQFFDDQNLTPRVQFWLRTYLGNMYKIMESFGIEIPDKEGNYVFDEKGEIKTTSYAEIFAIRRPLIEKWLERGKAWS